MQTIDRIFRFSEIDSMNSRSPVDYPPSTGITQIVRWRLGKASTWVDLSLKVAALGLLLLLLGNFQANRRLAQRAEAEAQSHTRALNYLLDVQKVVQVQNENSKQDRAHLNTKLYQAEQKQAQVQRALENAQRSFNEARDVLKRIEARSGK